MTVFGGSGDHLEHSENAKGAEKASFRQPAIRNSIFGESISSSAPLSCSPTMRNPGRAFESVENVAVLFFDDRFS